jgi:hypothetical protein
VLAILSAATCRQLSVLERFDSLIADFSSLFGGFDSLFARLGNSL